MGIKQKLPFNKSLRHVGTLQVLHSSPLSKYDRGLRQLVRTVMPDDTTVDMSSHGICAIQPKLTGSQFKPRV